MRGYHRRHERTEAARTDEWRRTRLLATILLNVNRDPQKTAAMSPEDVMWLPGDPPAKPPLEEEEFDSIMGRLAEFYTLQKAA